MTGALVGLVVWIAAAADDRVVVISPHNTSICSEFGQAFQAWHRETYGEPATVEWRNLGGTADALKFVQSEFAAKPDGIGIDCFFGGGPEPYLLLADKGLTTAYRVPDEILSAVPQSANGVELYDPAHRWYGVALSSFGILQNTRVQRRMGLPLARRWADLANPELRGWVGIADPRNSGTMNNMFEAFLQAYGWRQGWQLLTEIAGNTSKFDRLSSSTAKDVTLGEIAYGFAIDFYGFTQIAVAGRADMTFVLPDDFTAISPDGLCILKGAPHLAVAQRFLHFCLGEQGQRLWFLPRGHPEGPRHHSIERMAVRPDFYRRYRDVSNIAFSPFDLPHVFRYDARLARERREVVAALAGALLVDTHAELQTAWRAMIRRGQIEVESAELGRVPISEAAGRDLSQGPWKDASFRNRTKQQWQAWAQGKYRTLAERAPAPVPASAGHEPPAVPAAHIRYPGQSSIGTTRTP